jgi:hypothetical protein
MDVTQVYQKAKYYDDDEQILYMFQLHQKQGNQQ